MSTEHLSCIWPYIINLDGVTSDVITEDDLRPYEL